MHTARQTTGNRGLRRTSFRARASGDLSRTRNERETALSQWKKIIPRNSTNHKKHSQRLPLSHFSDPYIYNIQDQGRRKRGEKEEGISQEINCSKSSLGQTSCASEECGLELSEFPSSSSLWLSVMSDPFKSEESEDVSITSTAYSGLSSSSSEEEVEREDGL